MEDLGGKYILNSTNKVSEKAMRDAGSKILEKGSVVASCVGRLGIAAVSTTDTIINQQLQAFVPKGIKAEYLLYLVSLSKEYFESVGTAATIIYVNQQGFENMPVLLPSESEQRLICRYVDQIDSRYESLLNQSLKSIYLLKERRSALISTAVTGKIDIRTWQPPANPSSNAQPEPLLEAAHGR